jgi:ribosomal protein S18 acetylase RimI-like enzyme
MRSLVAIFFLGQSSIGRKPCAGRPYNFGVDHLLDNLIWHSLAGPHAIYSQGTHTARRYAPGFSPILGFSAAEEPDFDAVAPFCAAGENFYVDVWSGAAPAGWTIEKEATMFKMIWDAGMPDVDDLPEPLRLDASHAARALELAQLTHPGPFGLRTIELGEYFGFLEGQRLLAMAGERLHAGNLREISGVCTHPDYQGRGLARRLMVRLIRRELQRGEIPVLHVMCENQTAHRLYERMGFRDHRVSVVRVISPRG